MNAIYCNGQLQDLIDYNQQHQNFTNFCLHLQIKNSERINDMQHKKNNINKTSDGDKSLRTIVDN